MYALKLETASIQNYIFSSNKLKVNLGASFIVEHLLFKKILSEAVGEKNKNFISEWYEAESPESISANEELRVGYIGGGNAVLYGEKDKLSEVDEMFKRKVLEYFPGLEVYSGIIDVGTDVNERYEEKNKNLSDTVNTNRSAVPFINRTFQHGIFNSCHISQGPALFREKEADNNYVSDDVKVKFTGSQKVNEQHEKDLLNKEHRENYSFPLEFEKLSKKDDKAYIAVVHIDGNNMGQSFIDAKDLPKTQKLSIATRNIATNAYRKLLTHFIDEIENLDLELEKDKKDGRTLLPIRPIITGGDDITFVCEGTLGIGLASKFLRYFHEESKGSAFEELHACAGVAIVKQKYPFSKAYALSEELIKECKKLTRGEGNDGSYLAAMVAGFGTGASLVDLKNKYANKNLLGKPYHILGNQSEKTQSFEDIRRVIQSLKRMGGSGERLFPRNKLMELRFALLKGKDATRETWSMIKSRYPKLEIEKLSEGWIEKKEKRALLFEAIEWMDFYQTIEKEKQTEAAAEKE